MNLDFSALTPVVSADSIKYEVYDSYERFEIEVLQSSEEDLVLINFWATWCAPCVKELPYFEDLSSEGNPKTRVVLVSLDFVEQIDKRFIPFITKHNLRSELYILDDMDANKWIDMVDPSWSGTIPATLAIRGEKRKFTDKEFHSVQELKDFISIAS